LLSAKGSWSKKKISLRLAAKYSPTFGTICDRMSCSLGLADGFKKKLQGASHTIELSEVYPIEV
jgi:hypothetical protein